MSYVSFDELEQQMVSVVPVFFSNPIKDEAVIPSRSVRFREKLEDSIQFEKDSPPTACSDPDVKFQVPCDTVTSSSGCYQTNRVFTLVR
jgi:hypothetical protein